jgi:hypothetical protein
LLKPGGRLGYISSNTFFKTGSGKPLREYLAKNATLEHVVDFGDHQIFEGVTTYPAILTMVNHAPKKDHQISFWTIDDMPKENFRATYKKMASVFPQVHLGTGSWELENPALHALREKIRAGKLTLKGVYGSPLYGIKTGLNAAFVIDSETKDNICAKDPQSEELLKPFLEGKDLKRWRAEPRGLWLIYIPKNKIDIKAYPAIRDWLLPFKEQLEKRATKQEWFELQQAQEAYSPHFSTPKISYPHFCAKANFLFEKLGSFSNDKSYLVPTSDLALLGLLNSRVIWFILSSMSPPVRGGYHELRVQYVDTMPIPSWEEAEKSKLAKLAKQCEAAAEQRYQLQQGVRRRIPDLCPPEREAKLNNKLKSWWEFPNFAAFRTEIKKTFKADIPLADRSDWEDWLNKDKAEIARLSGEIKQHETAINKLVYDLFDLTLDEIELLEANI